MYIALCKTNQALRGHRDDLTQDSEQQGNFKDLIDFRIESGDIKLKEHLETASKNLTYLSKTTQNQLISTTSKFIRAQFLLNLAQLSKRKVKGFDK